MPHLNPGVGGIAGTTAVLAVLAVIAFTAPAALALTAGKNEKANLKACERRFCAIVVGRKPKGPDFACNLAKTWSKRDIKKGGKKSNISWFFGDAHCALDISMRRATIIGALTTHKFNIRMPLQTVNCKVERSKGVRPLTIKLAPKLEFKGGKVKKVFLRVKKINGPKDVRALIWTVAKLEDKIGIFHGSMLKSINKFLHRKCAKIINGKPRIGASAKAAAGAKASATGK